MGEELQLRLLGGVVITRGGAPVEGFISAKAQALLCYLAVTGHPHSRQALAGLLWGEMPEAAAQTNLRQALSNLRRLVGSHLRITRHTVAFDREAPYWLDVEAFEAEIRKGLPVERANLQPASLRAAVELYRGDFLAGFSVRGAPGFEEWAVVERERLWGLAVQALEQLAGHHAARGEHGPAIEYTRQLLALDPWREEAHRQMMLLLARRGQRSAALAQYETCRRVLAEELGVEPSAETKALYERIRTASEPRHNLPAEATSFVGREAELATLARRLANPGCRLITVLGPGGIGKTRLALQAAAQQVYAFLHGVCFVPLADLTTAALLAPAIAEALGLTLHSRKKPHRQLLHFLREKELLLILDNFEQLLSPPRGRGRRQEEALALVLEILREAPGVKLLVTSRERLKVQWEWVVELDGLPYPPLPHPSPYEGKGVREGVGMERYAAVRLFIERAQQVQWDFSLAEEGPAVAEICQLVEGMPLGIELAAGWVGERTCAEIAAGVAQSLNPLATKLRDVPPRHRSVRAAFDHSWALLPEAEQQAFRRLSVFRGGFSAKAARSVAGATQPILQALVDKSLLRRDASGRYSMHELLRQYAAEKLQAMPQEAKRAGDLHCNYYAGFLHQREAHLKGSRQKEALQEIEQEIENVRAGWDWAVMHGKVEDIERSLESLYHFYEMRGRALEGEVVFRKAAAGLVPDLVPDRELEDNGQLLARVLARQGAFCYHLGFHEKARALLQRSLAILRQVRNRQEMAFVLGILGAVASAQAEYTEAGELCAASLSLCRQMDDPFGSARALNQLGAIARMTGRHADAGRFFEQALVLAQTAQLRWMEARMLNGLGTVCGERGDWPTASQYFEQALQAYRDLGDRRNEGSMLSNLGVAYSQLGDYAGALSHFEEALLICREIGFRGLEGLILVNLGLLFHHLGDDEAACERCRRAMRLTQEIGERHIQAHALTFLGHALAGLGHLAEATEVYQQALALRQELGQPNLATEPLAGLARVSLVQGDLSWAQALVEEIMAYLEDHTLDGAEEPFLVYVTCYRVLRAGEDPRAQKVLDTAYYLLQDQANRIGDEKLRRSFLENVAVHREILSEWAQVNKFA
jgi:predicted ATPase/Tfp pilus assembly protein PilF